MNNIIEDELLINSNFSKKNWARMVSIAKRHFDIWAQKHLEPYCKHFKISYIHFIANVDVNGSTNNEIANRALIAKQAMSKIVKELEEKELIILEKGQKDGRSSKIRLAEKGKKLMSGAYNEVMALTNDYKKVVGEDRFIIAVEVLSEIIQYHERLEKITDA